MKSTTGEYYVALDHVRALAAFMVFTWHFTHGNVGYPVPFGGGNWFIPAALLDEGHTGVALFMSLSGYLFAKLLNGKSIRYGVFLWNRALRLLPLLLLVFVGFAFISVDTYGSIRGYLWSLVKGMAQPTYLPGGTWSIVVEFHFYLLLPFLLWMARKSRWTLAAVVVAFIALRLIRYEIRGESQTVSYWSIFGRVDQFVLGILAYHCRSWFARQHGVVAVCLLAFIAFYGYFDLTGGSMRRPSYPSPDILWVFMPTIEGVAYSVLIAWYDNSFSPQRSGFSGWIAQIGAYSYSLYLLHFFVIFDVARFVNEKMMPITNFYVALPWVIVAFCLMLPFCWLSFKFVEAPFLRLRRPYAVPQNDGKSVLAK